MRTLSCFLALIVFANLCEAQIAVGSSGPTDSVVVCASYSTRWNFVSNPVLRAPGTDSCRQVFCNIVPIGPCGCFTVPFGGGYIQPGCNAENGRGYWVKSLGGLCCITGGAITRDTIVVYAGWNPIGTISFPVAVSSVYTIPPGIASSSFFKYSQGYSVADTLRPGFGYWVKMSQPGLLVISSAF